ncbi:MAG TPA: pyridoxal-dependent decarboxylase [Acidimicrobiia bacterium]|jgi:aromatic-L-amino-acid decarboxylase
MDVERFRADAHQLVDWVASYLETVGRHPVLAQVDPGWVRAQLPSHPPESPEPFAGILADVDRIILPGVTHWQSPGFFGYFPANSSGPAILGDLLSAGLGVQGMLWSTSPACTELETHVLDWLVEICGLPAAFRSDSAGGGVIQGSASEANLIAVLAARESATHFASDRHGTGGDLIAYTSVHGHSSIEKAVRIAGLGSRQLRLLPVDSGFAMNAKALADQIAVDRADGLTPCIVVATLGTTSTTAVDPLRAIGEICREEGIWFHVDGAYAGSAAVLPEMRKWFDGLELADSYCFDPHKWLLTNFDCTAFYVTDRQKLIRALTVIPEYLRNAATESGAVIDYRDWQVPLGRRFRALKLWFVIRQFGVAGLRQHVRRHIELAATLAGWIESDPGYEVVAPHPFGLVCFRRKGGDEVNQQILDGLNRSGDFFLTHTRLDDQLTIRVAVGSPQTTLDDLERLWEAVREIAGPRSGTQVEQGAHHRGGGTP